MTMAMGILLLALSFVGYAWWVWSYLGIDREFIPVFVLSLIGCVVYFGGLGGVLWEGAVATLVVGIFLLAFMIGHMLHARRRPEVRVRLSDVLLLLVALAFLQLLCRSHLIHYDNFSHWAIVVKQMLSTNAFPTASSDLIDFKNYPLGTASFIYYVCLFAGHAQPTMIVAQNLLVFACLFAFFGVISEKGRFLLYAFLLLGISTLTLFNLSIRTDNLLVDFLLPIYALALFAAAYRYRQDLRHGAFVFMPVAGELLIIKSTGVVFAAFAWLFLLWQWLACRQVSGKNRRTILVAFMVVVLVSLLPYISWSWHVATSLALVQNKFATSVTSLASTEISKTPEQVSQLIGSFLRMSVDLTNRSTLGILVANVATIICYLLVRRLMHRRWAILRVLLALDVAVVVYYAGILAVYILSMPWNEASQLDGFERYASSVVILLVGALVLCAVVDIERSFAFRLEERPISRAFKSASTKRLYQQAVVTCLAVSLLLLLSELNGMQWEQDRYANTLPARFQQVTNDRWHENGTEDENRYLIYAPDTDGQVTDYYLQYVARYYLYAPNVDAICLFYGPNMDNLLSQYDYLVVAESDESDRALLSTRYDVSGEEGIYRIERDGDTITLVPE